jgi:hypothetical protein
MAQRLDVPGRLAEGREAVQHTQTYVSACGLRGYQHPDLTAYGAQVHDWYDGEEGMDLRLLDGDCAELWAVAGAAEEALRVQRAQLDELASAWRGPGADSAAGFVQRHCDAGAAVAAGIRSTAEACGTLRDELWRLIDDKVNTAVDIDDRAAAQRPAWLAAAHSVTAGVGDRQADDVIDQQVKPYVDNGVGVDWLTAMRSARSSVAAAYDAATAAATPGPGMVFPIPGELGPRYEPDELAVFAAPVGSVTAAVPSADPLPVDPPVDPSPVASPTRAGSVSPVAAPSDDPVAAPLEDAAAVPADAGLPAGADLPSGLGLPTGGGMPTGAGGLGGLIPRIVDTIGSLLGSPDDGSVDPGFDDLFDPALDEPFDEEPDEGQLVDETEPDDETEPADEVDETEGGPEPEEPTTEVAADAPADDAVAVPADEQAAAPEPEQPDQQSDTGEPTPCEIAADELPQAGQ